MPDDFDLDEPVELGPGLFKRFGDCTVAEHQLAMRRARLKAALHFAQLANLEAGRPPWCFYEGSDGYCLSDAHLVGPDTGLALCPDHRDVV